MMSQIKIVFFLLGLICSDFDLKKYEYEKVYHFDMIELNHFYDENFKKFKHQLIFWKWCPNLVYYDDTLDKNIKGHYISIGWRTYNNEYISKENGGCSIRLTDLFTNALKKQYKRITVKAKVFKETKSNYDKENFASRKFPHITARENRKYYNVVYAKWFY